MIEISAYAKINLFLDIQKRRADGYHDIVSVMQSVDWHDNLQIQRSHSRGITLTCSQKEIPTDERNTVYKAAKAFLEHVGIPDGVNICLEKHIPHEAGMAGGSADAAATLKGLNLLFGEPVSTSELLSIGAKIGADVPFCLLGGTKLVEGIGERLSPFPAMPDCFLVCAKMGTGVSTPTAYGILDKSYNDFVAYTPRTEQLESLRACFLRNRIDRNLYNIFEAVVEPSRPAVGKLKSQMLECGAVVAMMSGSGPSVFGIFESRTAAENAFDKLTAMGANCRICSPINEETKR